MSSYHYSFAMEWCDLQRACRRLGILAEWRAGIVYLCRVPTGAADWTLNATAIGKYGPIARTVFTDDPDLQAQLEAAAEGRR